MEVIRHIPARLIDRHEWDGWLQKTVNRRILAGSLFLDVFAPGWEALVIGNGDALMPLAVNHKWGLRYLFQPVFVQQLGIFMKEAGTCRTGIFLEKINSSFRFADIALNEMNHPDSSRFSCQLMDNCLLKLDRPYDKLVSGYDTNTRRNIRKSLRAGVELKPFDSAPEVVGMFKTNGGRLYPNIRNISYTRLKTILERGLADGFIEIRGAYSPGGDMIAALCILKDFDRYVFFFSANTGEGRSTGAMFLLVDSFIRQYAGSSRLFDFNGSVNPGVARFYKGFGATARHYSRVRISRLWYPLKKIKG